MFGSGSVLPCQISTDLAENGSNFENIGWRGPLGRWFGVGVVNVATWEVYAGRPTFRGITSSVCILICSSQALRTATPNRNPTVRGVSMGGQTVKISPSPHFNSSTQMQHRPFFSKVDPLYLRTHKECDYVKTRLLILVDRKTKALFQPMRTFGN